MAEKLADLITDNISIVRTLTKRGVMPVSTLTKWEMFVYYSGLKHPSKMQRYQETATHFKEVSPLTVMRAIKEMERTL